jgi:hypothetical protein
VFGAVLVPLVEVIQEEPQVVLVPLELGSMKTTKRGLAGPCQVDEKLT